MRMVKVLRSINHGEFKGVTKDLVPEDDVIARAIFGSSDYLLLMEKLILTEKNEEELKSLQEEIPRQKGYILELWERMEDPSRAVAMIEEGDVDILGVKRRLEEELKNNGVFGL